VWCSTPTAAGQYTAIRYTDRLAKASVGTVAGSYDNALAGALNGTFKAELIDRQTWRDRTEVEHAVLRWVGWYNHTRLHTQIGDVPPAEHEAAYHAAINTPTAA
jgi:putative transposase